MPNMGVSPIEFDYTQPTNQQWKSIIKQHLQAAASFEIHCWEEQTKWIDAALQYGEFKETEWSYGKVITGKVAPEFIEMLLNIPKPVDTEIYNKMTPFFSIFLDSGFSSEHYGTELYQLTTVEENK